MFPLACEVRTGEARCEWAGTGWQDFRKTAHLTPVIRVDVTALSSPELRSSLDDVLSQLPDRIRRDIVGIQFDVDCPERRLDEYRELLAWARRRIPPMVQLSATALPCHLQRESFRPVADQVDYFVLQVHGLEVPQSVMDDVSLMNPRVARAAIRAADGLDKPYLVALPCYAYELHFDRASGAFLGLLAEGPNPAEESRDKSCRRILSASPADVAALVREMRNRVAHPLCQGIVWFRLPVLGDRLCWDRDTVDHLRNATIPRIEVVPVWRLAPSGAWELSLKNRGVMGGGTADVTLSWKDRRGDADVIGDYSTIDAMPGLLPEAVTGPLPYPGELRKLGWFRPAKEQDPEAVVSVAAAAGRAGP